MQIPTFPACCLARILQVFGTLSPLYCRGDNRTLAYVVVALVGVAGLLFEGDRAANPKEGRNRCIAKCPIFFLRLVLLG